MAGFIERGMVRAMWAGDTGELVAHLMRLDAESRAWRFMGGVSDDYVERYGRAAIRPDTAVYGYFDQGVLRGVAELHPQRDGPPGQAEAAFSVERQWQQQGVGTELFRRLFDAARDRGFRRLALNYLPSNRAMQRLCAHFGARMGPQGREAILQLDTVDPMGSLTTEAPVARASPAVVL